MFWSAGAFVVCRASGGADGPDRIFVGGLPYYLSEEQIVDLLSSFGWDSDHKQSLYLEGCFQWVSIVIQVTRTAGL
jgi:RNA recognition motif-containing protein